MDNSRIIPSKIVEEMEKSYLDYAMSVIVARALPDVRDGLKPVHRRILYAMNEMNLYPTAKFTKSAKIVGETMGKFHPHGDMAIYDALVRLAQDFSLRYPLIWGQGNFGSVDGDPPAASRYTEAKLKAISMELLSDIDKDTVQFNPTYDDTDTEPAYLPAKLPNLLLIGAEGIAVGMATKIPTHNLTEVVNGVIAMIKKGKVLYDQTTLESVTNHIVENIEAIASGTKKVSEKAFNTIEGIDFESEITVEELLDIIQGPDFPTGGAIFDAESLKEVYSTGRGRIVVRGIAEIQETAKGKTQIVITELPYQVNKADLVRDIADLVRDKKLIGISDLRDESDKDGMKVVIDLKRDSKPKSVLNNLYKHTKIQTTFPANFVALVDGTPHTLNLKQILNEYVKHRQKVIVRRTIFELTEAKRRAHILEGLLKALDHLDEVIQTIRNSRTQEDAKSNLVSKFGFSEIQATAILDMQLRRLAALEREKIENEYKELMELIQTLIAILKNPDQVLKIIVDEITEVRKQFGDDRRTRIYKAKIGEFSEEDLVAKEGTLITVTRTGYVKRVSKGAYKAQNRGGKGVTGMTTKEEDEIAHLISATTHDSILFFTDRGKVYAIKAWEIPESSRQAKGQAAVNLLNLEQGEEIMSLLPGGVDAKHLIMVTSRGMIKKTAMDEFRNMRASGLIAIKLDQEDRLVTVRHTRGSDHILLMTQKGMSIRFPEENVRPMGRATSGVTGIKLGSEDRVIGMEVLPSKLEATSEDKKKKIFLNMFTVAENGLGKQTPIDGFPVQKRAGRGVRGMVINSKTGVLASLSSVDQETEQVVITSKAGVVIRLPIKNIPKMGRATQGVILMRFGRAGDGVAAVATLNKSWEAE